MYLDVFSDNSFETNCWLLGTDGTDEAVVVDPGFSPERVHAMLDAEGKRPVAAFATHGHFDHIGSAAAFCGDDLPFYIHEADVAALTDPQGWGAGLPDAARPGEGRSDGRGRGRAHVRRVRDPGHPHAGPHARAACACPPTPSCSRATSCSPARSGAATSPTRRRPTWSVRLERFLELPDPTDVLPGHGPRTTVGRERERNPFLQGR